MFGRRSLSFLLMIQLFLVAVVVRETCSVKCTMRDAALNTCQCVLSDGYSGLVDLTYIFKDGVLSNNQAGYRTYVQPCGTGPNKVTFGYHSSQPLRYYGNIANISMDWKITQFIPEDDKFEFVVTYAGSDILTPLEITYTYDASQDHKLVVSNFNQVYSNTKIEMKLKISSRYVKPVFTQDPDPASPYPLAQDVCDAWKRESSLVYQTGLINMAATVTTLNDSIIPGTPTYYLGICHSPVSSRGIIDNDNCFAVQRKPSFNTLVDFCLGRRLGAHLLDRRDQGWMLLTYPHGDFVPACKGYVVTEVYLTCTQDGAQESSALYPENTFAEVCRYQFIWPTHLACPNVTSPSQSPAFSNPYYILLGLSAAVAAVLLVVLVGLCIATCLFCRSGKSHASEEF